MRRATRRFRVPLLAALVTAAASLLAAHPAAAQISLTQSAGLAGNNAGTSATSTAFATSPKVGDTIVVPLWTWTENLAPNIKVTDSAGNIYTTASTATVIQSNWYESASVYYAPVVKTVASFTVTVTLSGNDSASQSRYVPLDYTGIGAVDQANAVTGTAAAAAVSTTAATKYANELVVSSFGVDNPADNFSTITAASGYTIRGVEYQNAGDTAGAGADKIVTTTGVQSDTFTVSPTLTGWAAAIATFALSTIQPDHYAISDAGTAVNCQASPVTITAMSSTQTAVATTKTITVSTSTGHGDWSLTSGAGSFTAGASNSGTATYTYVTADAGVVILSLKDTYPETVIVNVTDGTATQKTGTALASQQPPLTFVASGFIVTNGANVATNIGTQIAGKTSTQSLALQAVRTDINTGACTSAFASGATANISLAYQCNNPTSCVAGQTLAVTNNGTTTSIASNPNTGVSTYTTVPLKFSTANAEAPFSLNYSDAGQITLFARYNIPLASGAGSGNFMNGASQFVVQPYTFMLSNPKCTTYGAGTCSTALASPGNNPGAAAAGGAAFIPAGEPFSATVTAQNFQGAATPNFGQEVSPQGLALAASLVAPAGGDAPALNNASTFGAWSGGTATGTTFNWPEVGIITLTPSVGNYLGSGKITGTTSGNVGRFYPNSFAVALNVPVFRTDCIAGGFSYLGQPLTYMVAPVATVTAQALGGATTLNYTGAFMKIINPSLTGRAYTPTPASPSLITTGLPAIDPVIADLGTGQATLTFSAGAGLFFARGSAIPPFNANIALSINVIDTDGVVVTSIGGAAATNPVTFGAGTGIAFGAGAAQYYGRLALRDSVGSELLDLPMPLTAQYYLSPAVGFTTNTGDSCTTAPKLTFSNYQLNLVAGATCVRDTGNPGASGVGCAAPAPAASQYAPVAAAGNFNLILAAPGAGDTGALSVTAIAPSWLLYTWSGGVNGNPAGMGTFGEFPAPASRVHQREVY
jgi:MSHA biogenesis protein MshQ